MLCNFAALALVAPGRGLETARRTRGNGSPLHGKTFVRALDGLENAGLVRQIRGGWSRATGRHEVSRSIATPALLDYLPANLNPEWLRICPGSPIEVRARRDSTATPACVPTPITREAARLAAEVDAINAWLSGANIRRRDGVRLWLDESRPGLPGIASTDAWSLRRVFNNGTLAHGGRMVGGWWLGLSRADRAATILVDDEPTAELDFTAMVPRVCYALRGIPWPFGDDRDAPYIAGPQAPRAAWKQWVNAMLFARRPLCSWVGKSKAERLAFAAEFNGLHWKEARALVLKRHAALAAADGFGCELGMEAMRAESDIAAAVVLRLRDLGVPCLPIHDGFAVAASKAEAARQAMGDAAKARLGVDLAVSIKE